MCKKGALIHRDYCKRIIRQEGGEKEWIHIPRHQCDNPGCNRVHRMLPDFLLPFKHYQEEVIVDAIDGRLDPDSSDDRPSTQTVTHWRFWLMLNEQNINGYLKSIAHRELDFSKELLYSSISLLSRLRSSMPDGWLKTMIRVIYNAGGFLCPFYA